jgi:ADP-ribosylglycohydrolase
MVSQLLRAQGYFLGQLCGDALGSLVELRSPDSIRLSYPDGVRDMHDGGSWDTIAFHPDMIRT